MAEASGGAAAASRAAKGPRSDLARGDDGRARCGWAGDDALYRAYHDEEWGVPERDERRLFELLVLEGAQAGLSWLTVLRKREGYRAAFEGFDPERVARFDDARVERLLGDPGIVRHGGKVRAAVQNARAWLELRAAEGDAAAWLWGFVDGRPRRNRWSALADVPSRTPESEALSAELRRRGFQFVGPTICYAYMQAVGMVEDHLVGCFRHGRCR